MFNSFLWRFESHLSARSALLTICPNQLCFCKTGSVGMKIFALFIKYILQNPQKYVRGEYMSSLCFSKFRADTARRFPTFRKFY